MRFAVHRIMLLLPDHFQLPGKVDTNSAGELIIKRKPNFSVQEK